MLMNFGLSKILLSLASIFFITVFYIEGVYYFNVQPHNKESNHESDISSFDTIRIRELKTYLNCEFKIRDVIIRKGRFTINGKMPADDNHAFPGVGRINVVAFVYSNNLNLNNTTH